MKAIIIQLCLPRPQKGVEWTESNQEKCTLPALMNHICKLVKCVLYFDGYST